MKGQKPILIPDLFKSHNQDLDSGLCRSCSCQSVCVGINSLLVPPHLDPRIGGTYILNLGDPHGMLWRERQSGNTRPIPSFLNHDHDQGFAMVLFSGGDWERVRTRERERERRCCDASATRWIVVHEDYACEAYIHNNKSNCPFTFRG